MATLGEIEAAIDVLEQPARRAARITVLHCTTEYPTPMDEVNLRAMQTHSRRFRRRGGLFRPHARHRGGDRGRRPGRAVIEKHFTLDRNLPGPDHKASLEPEELKAMVAAIRNIEQALGDGIKRLTPSEARTDRSPASHGGQPADQSGRGFQRTRTSPSSGPAPASRRCAGMRSWAARRLAILRRTS